MVGRPSSRTPTEFGKKLAALREEAGLTQAALGERIGVSQSLVTYYERRGGNPTLEFISKAAAVLGVAPEALLPSATPAVQRRRGRPSEFEAKMAERIERLRRLPKEKQRFVLGMIDAALENAGAE
jgi:transcriptional regulator with XRE-family HTH domain